eukprot:COSAG03_NODE_1720_length_3603_cov_555.448345_3_plen_218_part_00
MRVFSGVVRQQTKGGENTAALRIVTELLMQKGLTSVTINEAQMLVKNGASDQEKLKGLRALARHATNGAEKQAQIVSGGILREALVCVKEHLGSPAIQRAGCVLIVNLARKTAPAATAATTQHGWDGIHPAPLTTALHHENLASHAAGPATHDTAVQSEGTPWMRGAIIDAGGLDVILGAGEELGCMGAYHTHTHTHTHILAHCVDSCSCLAAARDY